MLKRILTALAVILAVAIVVRLAWGLLRPAVPLVIVLLVVVFILGLIFRRPKSW